MNRAVDEPEGWSRPRWISYVLLAFAAHLGLIFAFGDRQPVLPRDVIHPPRLQLNLQRTELQTLADPTIFALPHPLGFAAASWLELPQVEFAPFRWSEPAQLLTLKAEQLGKTFLNFVQTNAIGRLTFESLAPPEATPLNAPEPTTTLRQHSSAQVRGDLAHRNWLNAPAVLQSWPAADLLTNSVVRVLAGPDGQVISGVLLPPGSGSKLADDQALAVAGAARFAPGASPPGKLTVGSIVFAWHTVPLPDTNAPASKPKP